METTGNTAADKMDSLLFVVLVPHRDCLPDLELYRRRLFTAGMDGAWSFPAAVPLALLKRPLSANELKAAAAELRKYLGNKKIVSSEEGECGGWIFGGLSLRFFGPILEMPQPAFPADAVLRRWEKTILAPAIIAPGSCFQSSTIPEGPAITWTSRAAALANLTLDPVFSAAEAGTGCAGSFDADYSFTWEMGPLYWLPRHTGKKNA